MVVNGIFVKSDDPGLTKIPLTTIDKTCGALELLLKDCQVEILEGSVEGETVVRSVIDAGRIMIAADSLGAAAVMIRKSVDYAKERKQFGRAIGSFQAVKHMCAQMAADLEPCYAFVWHAAHCFDKIPDESRLMSCHVKSHVSDVSKVIAKKATEVHGGMGFTDLMGVHYWFKRIGVNRQNLGSPEIVREEAAKIQNL
jgi:alkylation response protein AidB-like acyl-CoA dehydrogenase